MVVAKKCLIPFLDIVEDFAKAQLRWRKSGVHWIKSDIYLKSRPTGTYRKHAMRNLYSLCCRVLNFMVATVSKNSSDFQSVGLNSFQQVTKSFHAFNSGVQSFHDAGWHVFSFKQKYDLDIFSETAREDCALMRPKQSQKNSLMLLVPADQKFAFPKRPKESSTFSPRSPVHLVMS